MFQVRLPRGSRVHGVDGIRCIRLQLCAKFQQLDEVF
jgi:hypothetical protein